MRFRRWLLAIVLLLAVIDCFPPCYAQSCGCPCVEAAPSGPLAALKRRLCSWFSRSQPCDGDHVDNRLPPAPLKPSSDDKNWGVLLRTGAFQLGPGVGRDALRSQGDGKSGF